MNRNSGVHNKIMLLSDKTIRAELIKFLNNRTPAPNVIVEELRVHDGNAIADVVAVYKNAHCFEIKGENDTLNRILRQAEYYNTTFTKITLVTTENHLSNAEKLIPFFWGVLLAKRCGDKIRFTYLRKAKYNININKSLALSMLWKSELISIANNLDNIGLKKSSTRAQLAEIIADNKSKECIVSDITSSIFSRYGVKENSWPTKDI